MFAADIRGFSASVSFTNVGDAPHGFNERQDLSGTNTPHCHRPLLYCHTQSNPLLAPCFFPDHQNLLDVLKLEEILLLLCKYHSGLSVCILPLLCQSSTLFFFFNNCQTIVSFFTSKVIIYDTVPLLLIFWVNWSWIFGCRWVAMELLQQQIAKHCRQLGMPRIHNSSRRHQMHGRSLKESCSGKFSFLKF